MAISRSQKEAVVAQVKDLVQSSKLTVIVAYQGTSVAQFQALRSEAQTSETVVRVIKNSLMRQALKEVKLDTALKEQSLEGMLAYVFNDKDEVAGAQVIKRFAKSHHAPLKFVGAITADGEFLLKERVSQLADLPSQVELIGRLLQALSGQLTGLQQSINPLPQLLSNLQASKDKS